MAARRENKSSSKTETTIFCNINDIPSLLLYFIKQKARLRSGVIVHMDNPSTWEAEAKCSLGYIWNSRLAWAI
jgi:hypothetical protein